MRKQTKHENTCSTFLYDTNMAADGYKTCKALILRGFLQDFTEQGLGPIPTPKSLRQFVEVTHVRSTEEVEQIVAESTEKFIA